MTTVGNARVTEILSLITADKGADASLPVRLCEQCLAALPVTGVGMALMTDDRPSGVVLAATDAPTRQLEELQFSLDEGPCIEASRGGRPVLQSDLAAAGSARWPRFGVAVLEAGIRAIFALPLRVGAISIGVLDLYRDTPGRLTAHELAEALAFADAAIVVVLHLQDHSPADGEHAALAGPIDSRAEIHQATGMIAIQLGVDLAGALLRLRAHAYAMGRTVSEVATDVVGRRLRFSDGEPGRANEDQP